MLPTKVAVQQGGEQSAEAFYAKNAVHLPGHSTVNKRMKKPKMVLTKPVGCLSDQFVLQHPDAKMPRRTFFRRRPTHILPSKNRAFRQCLCDTCFNHMIKMSKLKQMTQQPIKTVDELVLETVCGIFTRDCVERACSLCGVDQFCTRLRKTLQQQEQLNQSVVWRKWEKIADKVGKRKRSCGEKRGLCWPCQDEA